MVGYVAIDLNKEYVWAFIIFYQLPPAPISSEPVGLLCYSQTASG